MRPPHKLVTWSGDLVVGGAILEQWSFSLRCEPDLNNTPAMDNVVASACKDAWQGWAGGVISNVCRLKRVRVASITELGKYGVDANGAYQAGEWVGDLPGSEGSAAILPPQSSLVISLTTARSGATGRGRFFLPMPRKGLDVDGRLTVAQQNDTLTIMKGFLNDVNAVANLGRIVVSSSKGYESLVTGVRVGRAVDTLRSRRGKIIEAYASAAL
jgi:hypothetical protein